MGGQPFPQALQDAQIELETLQWLWESTEEQMPVLIDATIQRIADQFYPFYEDNEAAILQRERTEHGMQRISRATTLLQAWAIFEDAASWAAEERRRQGHTIGKKRSGESFTTWAGRELTLCADKPWRDDVLEWMEMLCRLRSMIIHANGQYTRMQLPDKERVDQWVAKQDVPLNVTDGRIDVLPGFVSTALHVVSMAISGLSEAFREQHT
jgi:hypothetical protein